MVILQYKNNYQYWKKSFIYLEFRLSPLYIFIKTILLESPGNFPLQRTACSCVCRAIRMYFMSPLRVFIFEIATGHFRSQVFIEKRAGYFFQSVDLVSTLHLTKKIFFCFPFPEIKELLKILSHDKLFNSKYRFKSVKKLTITKHDIQYMYSRASKISKILGLKSHKGFWHGC